MMRMQWIVALCLPGDVWKGSDSHVGRRRGQGKCLVYVGTYTGAKSKGIYACGSIWPAASERAGPGGRGQTRRSWPCTPTTSFCTRSARWPISRAADRRRQRVRASIRPPASSSRSISNRRPAAARATWSSTARAGTCWWPTTAAAAWRPCRSAPTAGWRRRPRSIQHTGNSVDPARQEGPHAHSINLDPANRFAFVADLGLDKVMVYRLDSGDRHAHAQRSAVGAGQAGFRPAAFRLSSQRQVRLRHQRDDRT